MYILEIFIYLIKFGIAASQMPEVTLALKILVEMWSVDLRYYP